MSLSRLPSLNIHAALGDTLLYLALPPQGASANASLNPSEQTTVCHRFHMIAFPSAGRIITYGVAQLITLSLLLLFPFSWPVAMDAVYICQPASL